jgi:hypothetical protein
MGDSFGGLFADYPPMDGGIAWPVKGADGWYSGAWRFPQTTLASEYVIEMSVTGPVEVGEFQTTLFAPLDAERTPTLRVKNGRLDCGDEHSNLQICVTISDARGGLLPFGYVLGFRFLPFSAA